MIINKKNNNIKNNNKESGVINNVINIKNDINKQNNKLTPKELNFYYTVKRGENKLLTKTGEPKTAKPLAQQESEKFKQIEAKRNNQKKINTNTNEHAMIHC